MRRLGEDARAFGHPQIRLADWCSRFFLPLFFFSFLSSFFNEKETPSMGVYREMEILDCGANSNELEATQMYLLWCMFQWTFAQQKAYRDHFVCLACFVLLCFALFGPDVCFSPRLPRFSAARGLGGGWGVGERFHSCFNAAHGVYL